MKNYIGYYRVSTEKQGESGLGLNAQAESVNKFLQGKGKLIQDFTEVESGRNSQRPLLQAAINKCIETGSTLVIAKLDRLSRDANFILTLQKSNVEFICVDMPDANNLTVGIMALFAQQEVERTSKRTVDSLKEIKRKISLNGEYIARSGNVITSLGGTYNFSASDRKKASDKLKELASDNFNNKRAEAYIKMMMTSGIKNKSEMARQLNENGFVTSKGKAFTSTQVSRLMK